MNKEDRLETRLESHCLNCGISLDQHDLKMFNLGKLAKLGYRIISPISHDLYRIKGIGLYNPYDDEFLSID